MKEWGIKSLRIELSILEDLNKFLIIMFNEEKYLNIKSKLYKEYLWFYMHYAILESTIYTLSWKSLDKNAHIYPITSSLIGKTASNNLVV